MRHNTLTIQKAIRLRGEGYSYQKITELTGVSSGSARWHIDPEYREQQVARGEAWRKKNPNRWHEIARKAMANYKKRHAKT